MAGASSTSMCVSHVQDLYNVLISPSVADTMLWHTVAAIGSFK
jgi:hypothetical protein